MTNGMERRPLITLGQGINLGLVIVLLGAAWQLGEKIADVRVFLAQAQGGIDVLSARVEALADAQDRMQDDLNDIRQDMKGIGETKLR